MNHTHTHTSTQSSKSDARFRLPCGLSVCLRLIKHDEKHIYSLSANKNHDWTTMGKERKKRVKDRTDGISGIVKWIMIFKSIRWMMSTYNFLVRCNNIYFYVVLIYLELDNVHRGQMEKKERWDTRSLLHMLPSSFFVPLLFLIFIMLLVDLNSHTGCATSIPLLVPRLECPFY